MILIEDNEKNEESNKMGQIVDIDLTIPIALEEDDENETDDLFCQIESKFKIK